ncbi:MAG TPA: xanthine dehydrogenase accessory protein XdhC [Casimicrobiaceae bacterium]|nr:xanthine dehydrogenase accessory protein XdhC [Casimicrobiaceae bacterium]
MNDVIGWLGALEHVLAREADAVLVVVAAAKGSTPRETGAAMVVTHDAAIGSIGGGHLEYEATRVAREALRGKTDGTFVVRYPLAASLGQCCGGVATLAFTRLDRNAAAWLDAASGCARTGAPFAIVSRVTRDEREAGRLVVTADDVRGTLGDAVVDSDAIGVARARLAAGSDGAALVAFGNDATAPLLVHIVRTSAFPVLVFGNGHVGRALVRVLGVVPAQVRWIDERAADFAPQVPPNVEVVATDVPDEALAEAPPGAFIVIATHSHALDLALVEAVLARDDWAYVGLIGSRAKRGQFERRLAARGFSDAFARIRCPIGTTVAIAGKHPGVIAVAIAAELLAAREQHAQRANPLRAVERVAKLKPT